MISDQRLKETVSEIFLHGKDVVAKRYNVTHESLSRYVRLAKDRGLLADIYNLADRRPNVLVLDIETTPILGSFWRLGKQSINYQQVMRDRHLLSYAVKWLFEPDIFGDILTADEAIKGDDLRITEDVWEFVDKADIIIAHNGVRFDMSMLNTRFMMHDIMPPSPYQIIDTLKVFHREANFTSNKQGYLNQVLKLEEKMEHEGLKMWHRCLEGDGEALDMMMAYNKQDVVGLEDLYVKVRPWIHSHPNMALYYHDAGETPVQRCHRCLSTNLEIISYKSYVTGMNRYSTYRCKDCHGVTRARETEITREQRSVLTASIAR